MARIIKNLIFNRFFSVTSTPKFLTKRILYYCSSSIDEIWIRPLALASKNSGLDCAVVIIGKEGSIHSKIRAVYSSSDIPLAFISSTDAMSKIKAEVVVTASSGVRRETFPSSLNYLVHTPHSLISLHMGYPSDAFDGYDVLFGCGPHHIEEFNRISEIRGLGKRLSFQIGYSKLDLLMKNYSKQAKKNGISKHVLVAPSWGEGNVLEVMGRELIGGLLDLGYRVTLRPHPSQAVNAAELIANKCVATEGAHNFELEKPADGDFAILEADLLITDFSGISMEFKAIENRPIIFVDGPKKIFNSDWALYDLPVAEIDMRPQLGVVAEAHPAGVIDAVSKAFSIHNPISLEERQKETSFVYNVGACGEASVQALQSLLMENTPLASQDSYKRNT
ncbi:CDP-glycerol glycerophosphotransferase family protein [Alphaproteobacteria bacterium]|nr:CDP-glycerol glycerophosphotransferase family protein [Alphaproteobacteria bacterium]